MHTRFLWTSRPPRARSILKSTKRGASLQVDTVIKYVVSSLLLVLFQATPVFGWTPLAFGLFVGLIYSKQNLLIVGAVYLLSGILFDFSVWTLLYAGVPLVVFAVAYFTFYRLKRSVTIPYLMLFSLPALAPYAICNLVFSGAYADVSICVALALVFGIVCSIATFPINIRGINCRFTQDEKIALCLVLSFASFALMRNPTPWFNFFYLFSGALIPLVACCFSPASAFAVYVFLGVGAALGGGGLTLFAFVVLCGASALALKPLGRFAPAAASVVAYAFLTAVVSLKPYDWVSLVSFASLSPLFAFLPNRARSYLKNDLGGASENASVRALINRDRIGLSKRLSDVGEVFFNLSKSVEAQSDSASYTSERLAGDVARNYCGRCPEREGCFASLGHDTSSIIAPMASAALNRGKITILDMPPFVTSRCRRMTNLVEAVNSAADGYRNRLASAESVDYNRSVLSEQFAGMSLVLSNLAEDCGSNLVFDSEREERLKNELLRHNVVCSEAIVSGADGKECVDLTVRERDVDKAVLPKIVGSVLGRKMCMVSGTKRGGGASVRLEPSALYDVVFGSAERHRDGEDVSGDVKTVLRPCRERSLFAISDGMGSGIAANEVSRRTLLMIENFYKAGFPDDVVLALVNKLLSFSDGEHFSALDIAVADVNTGGLDLIKLGASSGFIIHPDSIEVVSSSAPPVGILDKVEPVINRYRLRSDDVYVMMSDGVFDALDATGVQAVVDEQSTLNPQVLADALLDRALYYGATDDCTVLALRLVAA